MLSVACAAVLIAASSAGASKFLYGSSAITASAETSGSCGADANYTLDDSGKLTITGTGELSGGSFSSLSGVNSVEIGNGITSIPNDVFGGMNIQSIVIPQTVTFIDYDAFYNCTSLTQVYCYADPELLEWTDKYGSWNADDFTNSTADPTSFHVPCDLLDEYEAKFSADVNVQFVGDLPQAGELTFVKAKPATCKSEGNIQYFCKQVGEETKYYSDRHGNNEITLEQTVIPIDPDAHVWDGWKIIKPVTAAEKGIRERTCTECGITETVEFDYSAEPSYLVTIPASAEMGETTMMKIEFVGDHDALYHSDFADKGIFVQLDKINGADAAGDNFKLHNEEDGDDHQADIDYSVDVSVRSIDLNDEYRSEYEYNGKLSADSVLLRACLDTGSTLIYTDSAKLTFSMDADAAANAPAGTYKSTLTFKIFLANRYSDTVLNDNAYFRYNY